MLDKEANIALFGISSDLHILQKVKFSFISIILPINNFLHQMMKGISSSSHATNWFLLFGISFCKCRETNCWQV